MNFSAQAKTAILTSVIYDKRNCKRVYEYEQMRHNVSLTFVNYLSTNSLPNGL